MNMLTHFKTVGTKSCKLLFSRGIFELVDSVKSHWCEIFVSISTVHGMDKVSISKARMGYFEFGKECRLAIHLEQRMNIKDSRGNDRI